MKDEASRLFLTFQTFQTTDAKMAEALLGDIVNEVVVKMANKSKDILISLDDLNNLASQFGLQQRAIDHVTPVPAYREPKVETISYRGHSNIVRRKHDVSKKIEGAKGGKDQINYLLVLDDVWDVMKWEDLQPCLEGINTNGGNRVIVTTHKEAVASTVQARSEIHVFKELLKSFKFKRLRVLKLVDAHFIFELPDSLGELKHLSTCILTVKSFNQIILETKLVFKHYPYFLWVQKGGVQLRRSSSYNSKEVMESLQLHSNLQSLTVSCYEGSSFPSWMLRPVGDFGLFLLNNLMELNLFYCENCESLPPLGQLQNLQFLNLRNLRKVKGMGNEFYFNQGIDDMNKVIKVFPALKKFTLSGMERLEEWTAMATTKTIMFPCFEELNMWDCPLLKSVPLTGQYLSLGSLRISNCKTLSKIGDKLSTSTCLKELDLHDCLNLSSIPDLKGFSSLQNLSIASCAELEQDWRQIIYLHTSTSLKILDLKFCFNLSLIPKLEGFSCLQNLSIQNCDELEVLPMTGRCSSLEKVNISSCKKLSKIGDGLSTSSYLNDLDLYGCPKLRPIPSLDGLSSLTELKLNIVGEGWSCLLPNMFRSNTSLRSLRLLKLPDLIWIPDDSLSRLYCLGKLTTAARIPISQFHLISQCLHSSCREKLKSLPPPQLQFLTALEALTIQEFQGIEALPERLGNLSSLRCLRIYSCNKLMYLPSVQVMRCLSKLQEICILYCPQLETRCDRESGPEWSKISHIPQMYINDRSLGMDTLKTVCELDPCIENRKRQQNSDYKVKENINDRHWT
ncbi:hypothetical protein CXB51_003512 [Gossypium anomalum]|uniref:NB-ARC domain-containing protein n=1 Tax=Gossypium anomalum TaxID=47600 RepID=A0A8J5ZGG4_9ROSI|nr:hypothetical protein CXB51_003512 [Gossypium anomalum]